MKTRQTLLVGLAGLGFVLAMPSHAESTTLLESPASIVQGFVLAARDRENAEVRHEQRRDSRDKERARGQQNQQMQNQQMRDAERFFVPPEYGYGYERRQQPKPHREEDRYRD